MCNFICALARGFRLLALAAASAGALAFAGCGGGGGYGGGGNSPPPPTPPSKAFAADPSQLAIGSVVNPDPGAGPLPIDRIIMGPSTGLTSNPLTSLFLDAANDRLYVGSGGSILVFNNASTASGDVSPARTVTGLGLVDSLFLDAAADRLYVGDAVQGVRVFDGASSVNGAATSSRFLRGSFGTLFEIFGVAVDTARDILYVSAISTDPASSNHINVFDSAHLADGSLTPIRTIVPTITGTIQSVRGIFLDSQNDRLYVAGSVFNTVMVFESASTATGAIAPAKVLAFPASGGISNVWVDTVHDRLYAVSNLAIYVLNNASTAIGATSAKAALAPGGGGFSAVAVAP